MAASKVVQCNFLALLTNKAAPEGVNNIVLLGTLNKWMKYCTCTELNDN